MRGRQFLVTVFIVITVMVLGFMWFAKLQPSFNRRSHKTGMTVVRLSEYAKTDAVISYTRIGITNAESLHRAIRITVSRNAVSVDILAGYHGEVAGKVIKSQSFINNQEAFAYFLASLQTLGYMNKREISENIEFIGQCPLGNKYVFQNSNIDGLKDILWTTSCSSSQGNFAGKLNSVQQLFINQVPNYSQFVAGVNLS